MHFSDGQANSGNITLTAGDLLMWLTGARPMYAWDWNWEDSCPHRPTHYFSKVNTCALEQHLPNSCGRQPPAFAKWLTEIIINSQDFGSVYIQTKWWYLVPIVKWFTTVSNIDFTGRDRQSYLRLYRKV